MGADGGRCGGTGNSRGKKSAATRERATPADGDFCAQGICPGIRLFLDVSGKSVCDPVLSVCWMTGDLPITLAGRMMKPWQQHPLSRESPSSPENAGDDRAFATCVFASKTFLKCSLPGRQRIRFLLTTLIWSGRTSARVSSTPPSISTILSSSDKRMKCGSSSMPSCHHRWHGS